MVEKQADKPWRDNLDDLWLNSVGLLIWLMISLQDPNWYRAKNAKGQRGMIPYNYVKEKLAKGAVKLDAMP